MAKDSKITPEHTGCSQLACDIINNTFLSLDGFAKMRREMDDTEYTAEQFAAELARVADRSITIDLQAAFKAARSFDLD